MVDNRSYLSTTSLLLASTALVTGSSLVTAGLVLTTGSVGSAYEVCIALGLGSLLASLIMGGFDLIRNVAMLGCEGWNVRRVTGSLMLRIVLLCLGTLLMVLSLFLI